MPKASPLVRSLNAGEFSKLMEGRTDLDKYPSSMRQLMNTVAALQGPGIARSGTEFINEGADATDLDNPSSLIPFVFSETDFYMLEFGNHKVRFLTENGVLTYAPVAVTAMTAIPFTFTSAALTAQGGAVAGDQIALANFPPEYNLEAEVVTVTAVAGDVYTVDATFPDEPNLTTFTVAKVYEIASPYTSVQAAALKDIPSLDEVYLVNGLQPVYRLDRNDTYDWSINEVTFDDGPYLDTNQTPTTFAIDNKGKATPDMASASQGGWTVTTDAETSGFFAWMAFDADSQGTFWQGAEGGDTQFGILAIWAPAAYVCDGYSITIPNSQNTDVSYTNVDYAPCNFTFEGSHDGVGFDVLDRQNSYVLYDNNKSVFFKIPNQTAYSVYRLTIASLTRNGPINPRVSALTIRSTTSTAINLTASSTTNVNNNRGFLSTDVGRIIRMQGSDNNWRQVVITAVVDATHVTVNLLGEPFGDLTPMQNWRMGAYSDTTGYPNTGTFQDDRLWLGGSDAFPDLAVASETGNYESMSPTADDGTVLATNGISVRLNTRQLSRIKWMSSTKDGLALGTGSKEFVIKSQASDTKTLNPADGIRAVDSGSRGSSNVVPAEVDAQVLFMSRGSRTMREFAYDYATDSYKAPSMSSLASHIGIKPITRLAYAAEPIGIVWCLRNDGSVVGLTYNRDENVIGWHRHDFGGYVESLGVLPSTDQLQDILWLVIRRTVNGVTKRYIEKLTKFWDFDMVIDDAWYVDCGLRYTGDPITRVYGLQHLEGQVVYGVADNTPVGPFTVVDGSIDLPTEASNVVIGLGFESIGETSRLENGAADGTAQGKVKRFNGISLLLWQSYYGQIGTWNGDTNEVVWADIDYEPADASIIDQIALFDGIVGPVAPQPGYEKNGSLLFRRTMDKPMPFNVVALMPQMNTQDRG